MIKEDNYIVYLNQTNAYLQVQIPSPVLDIPLQTDFDAVGGLLSNCTNFSLVTLDGKSCVHSIGDTCMLDYSWDCITGNIPRTVSMWVYRQEDSSDNQGLFYWGCRQYNDYFGVQAACGDSYKLQMAWGTGDFEYLNASIPLLSWTHVCISYGQNALKYYINSVIKSFNPSTTFSTSSTKFSLGYRGGGDNYWRTASTGDRRYIKGGICKVKVFNKCLNDKQIKALYYTQK